MGDIAYGSKGSAVAWLKDKAEKAKAGYRQKQTLGHARGYLIIGQFILSPGRSHDYFPLQRGLSQHPA